MPTKKYSDLPVLKDLPIDLQDKITNKTILKYMLRFILIVLHTNLFVPMMIKVPKKYDGDINHFVDTMVVEYKQCMNLLNKHFNKEIIMTDQDRTNFKSIPNVICTIKKSNKFSEK